MDISVDGIHTLDTHIHPYVLHTSLPNTKRENNNNEKKKWKEKKYNKEKRRGRTSIENK